MTLLDRLLLRKTECAAILDLLRRDGRADSARVVEARMQAWADALTEARDAGAGAPPRRDAKIPHIDHDAIDPRELHRALHPVSAPGATSSPVERVAPSATAPDSGRPSLPPLLRPFDTPADAADAAPAKVWTDDRLALLRTLYAQADLTLDDIAARINALPGVPVSSPGAVKAKASKLGLAGPGLAKPPQPASAPAPALAQRIWTPERVDLLRTLYAEGLHRTAILPRINALPGPPCASVTAMMMKAGKLGLTRSTAPAAPASAAPPALASKPAEDIEEARQMMRAGNIGALALSEYFGWPLDEAQAIAAEIRAEAAAQGQAA